MGQQIKNVEKQKNITSRKYNTEKKLQKSIKKREIQRGKLMNKELE